MLCDKQLKKNTEVKSKAAVIPLCNSKQQDAEFLHIFHHSFVKRIVRVTLINKAPECKECILTCNPGRGGGEKKTPLVLH